MKKAGRDVRPFLVWGLCLRGRSGGYFAGFLDCFGLGHPLVEAVNAAFGVDELLATGIERVAGGADFDAEVSFIGRPSLKGAATGTRDLYDVIGGVDSSFHNPTRIAQGAG